MSRESKNPVKREYGGKERNAFNSAIRAELPWIAPFVEARSHIVRCASRFGGRWSDVGETVASLIAEARSAITERCEGKRERAFEFSGIRRYRDFNDMFANFLGGRKILEIEAIACDAPDTDSWDTVLKAVDESKRAAANALKNPPPNRGPKATATREEPGKNGTSAIIIAMMRDDPEFAQEVETLAFRYFQKKMGKFQK